MELVRTKLENNIGTVTMDHDRKLNSLNRQLIMELITAFDEMETANAHVVVLRANSGVKVWSAGHDIRELPDGRRDPLGYHDPLETLIRRVQDFPFPVIAMVEGSVWGGSCDLCISCDMIVCTEAATFAITPAKIGVPYNASGLVHFLNVLGPKKAKEMFYTARPIKAQEALNSRMVNHMVPVEELETKTYSLAEMVASNAPMAVRVLKQQFRLLLKGQMLSSETFESVQAMRRLVYDSEDYVEGLLAFREKRKPNFKGC